LQRAKESDYLHPYFTLLRPMHSTMHNSFLKIRNTLFSSKEKNNILQILGVFFINTNTSIISSQIKLKIVELLSIAPATAFTPSCAYYRSIKYRSTA